MTLLYILLNLYMYVEDDFPHMYVCKRTYTQYTILFYYPFFSLCILLRCVCDDVITIYYNVYNAHIWQKESYN